MTWKFELNTTEIDEPIGFDEIVFTIQRDEVWHGIFIEASTSKLGFYGSAYNILKTAKEQYGVDAEVVFTASVICEGETEYTEAISGKLNFGQYEESCGNDCIINIPVEQDTCAMVFKNRFDQKVNIDSNIAFDKQTLLENYHGLGFNMELATQVIPISADAQVVPAGDTFNLTDASGATSAITLVRPTYGVVRDNSINTGELDNPLNNFQQDDGPFLLSPQVLLEENEACILDEWNYDVRMKGRVKLTGDNAPSSAAYLVFGYWLGDAIIYNTITDIEPEFTIQNGMVSGVYYNFDRTYTGSIAIPEGAGVYAFVKQTVIGTDDRTYDITFDAETYFLLYNDKSCPPTNCQVYLINETLSRITESITDRCLTVDSEYYGRVDSKPYAETENGCGGLRILTSGLKIRQADNKQFFVSMREVMLGLRAIDNIGMGMDNDRVRIESAEYFYQDVKVLDMLYIPKSKSRIDEALIYTNLKTGYNNWAIESIKGIDEFNSYKERRTGIKAVSNELDISSDLVASGYIIDKIRTSTLLKTGEKDNKYDDNVFIICIDKVYGPQTREVYFGVSTPGQFFFLMSEGNFMVPGDVTTVSGTASNNGTYHILTVSNDGVYFYFTTTEPTVIENGVSATFSNVAGQTFGMTIVEQGVTQNAANFYSPATAYNWRIRPLYNVMRWFKSIAQSYVNLFNTTSKIYFTSGTGNYLATGNLDGIYTPDPCRMENGPLAENADIDVNNFDYIELATPMYKPEVVEFEYPLSIADYKALKVTPYGYINLSCGNGQPEKAFIRTVSYKPAKGIANFTLIKKWV